MNTTDNKAITIRRGTIPQAFFEFFDFRPSTANTYRRELAVFVDYLTENGISKPTAADIIAYRDELAKDLKPSTLRTRMAAIKRFFTWTAQTGQYPNIAANIRPPQVSREFKKDFLTLEEAAELEDSIDTHGERGKRDRAIVSLMLTAGLRDVEITRAKIKHIEKSGGEWWLKVWGKGHDDTDRRNRITEPEILFDYIDSKYKGAEPPAEDYIFTSVSNNTDSATAAATPMNPGSISRIIKNRLRYIGIDSPEVTAHSLRHTAGAQAIEAGESLEDVSEMLGHASTAITKTYTHGLQRKHNRAEYSLKAAIDRARERRKKI